MLITDRHGYFLELNDLDNIQFIRKLIEIRCFNFYEITYQEEAAYRELEKLKKYLISHITDGIFKTQEDYKENQITS